MSSSSKENRPDSAKSSQCVLANTKGKTTVEVRKKEPVAVLLTGLCKEADHPAPKFGVNTHALNMAGTMSPFKPAVHGYIDALMGAYAGHFGFVLDPAHLQVLIGQRVADHINKDPNAHAKALGTEPGAKQKDLVIERQVFGEDIWPGIVRELADEVLRHVKPNAVITALNTPSSTDTLATYVARAAVICHTYQTWFRYMGSTSCGIPRVVLRGEAADYTAIRKSLAAYDILDLKAYRLRLESILDKIISAFDKPDEPDVKFWNDMFAWSECPSGSTGKRNFSGWILEFMDPPGMVNGELSMVQQSVFGTGKTRVPFIHEKPGENGTILRDKRMITTGFGCPLFGNGDFAGLTLIRGIVCPHMGWAVTEGNIGFDEPYIGKQCTVSVKMLSGKVWALNIEPGYTLADIKARIFEHEGMPPHQQSLMVVAKNLEDIGVAGLKVDDTIYVLR